MSVCMEPRDGAIAETRRDALVRVPRGVRADGIAPDRKASRTDPSPRAPGHASRAPAPRATRRTTLARAKNSKGAKGFDGSFSLVEDEDDELRNEIGIAKDFGILGGRETYVVDKSGTIQGVHNNQFDPNSHVTTSLTALGPVQKQFDLFDYKVVAGLFGINLY